MPKPKHFKVNYGRKAETGTNARARRAADRISEDYSDATSPTRDGRQLKQAYTYEYRVAQLCQGKERPDYWPSPTLDGQGLWHRQAAALRSKGLDPVDYVMVLFVGLKSCKFFNSRVPKQDRPPSPLELTNDECMALHDDTIDRGNRSAQVELRLEYAYFKNAVETGVYLYKKPLLVSLEMALRNGVASRGQLSPLFCHGMALSRMRMPETNEIDRKGNEMLRAVAHDKYEMACRQYLTNAKGYSTVWGPEALSPTVKREAARMYQSLISKLKCDS